jgi:hypothetical protein
MFFQFSLLFACFFGLVFSEYKNEKNETLTDLPIELLQEVTHRFGSPEVCKKFSELCKRTRIVGKEAMEIEKALFDLSIYDKPSLLKIAKSYRRWMCDLDDPLSFKAYSIVKDCFRKKYIDIEKLITVFMTIDIEIYSYDGYYTDIFYFLVDRPEFNPGLFNSLALALAAMLDDHDLVFRLIQDPRVDPSTENNYVAFWAAWNNHTDILQILFQKDVFGLEVGFVPASARGNTVFIQLLLNRGLVPDFEALLASIEGNQIETFHLIIPHVALQERVQQTIQMAVEYDNNYVFDYMFQHYYNQIDSFTVNLAFRMAIIKNNRHIFDVAYSHPFNNPAALDNWAIRLAVQHNRTEIFYILINDDRVNPCEIENALMNYALHKNLNMFYEILNSGKCTLTSDLIMEAFNNGESLVISLLKYSITKNLPRAKQLVELAFIKSCGLGFKSVFLFCLQFVDPTLGNNQCMKSAVVRNHATVVRELLKDERVDPTFEGNFAIRAAVLKRSIEVLQLLVQDQRVTQNIEDKVFGFQIKPFGN